MLPEILREDSVYLFKFWFNDSLKDGMHVRNELYYRLKKLPTSSRSRLYQVTCRLSQKGADVLMTVDEEQCSLWANLRNQKVASHLLAERLS